MKSYPAPAIRFNNEITCVCDTVLSPPSPRKRQRQWSEQNVSACPSGQTFTPRLLIIVNFKPSPLNSLSLPPRSFGEPLVQSRKTSTPTSSFFGVAVEATLLLARLSLSAAL